MGFCPLGIFSLWDIFLMGFCPLGIFSYMGYFPTWDFFLMGFCPLGFCPLGFCSLGFCPHRILSSWDFIRIPSKCIQILNTKFFLQMYSNIKYIDVYNYFCRKFSKYFSNQWGRWRHILPVSFLRYSCIKMSACWNRQKGERKELIYNEQAQYVTALNLWLDDSTTDILLIIFIGVSGKVYRNEFKYMYCNTLQNYLNIVF